MNALDVVLPTRDGGPLLGQAVESILSQTFGDFLLWIVDDASRDGSVEKLPRDPRMRIVKNDGTGLVAALNTGLSRSGAAWIARADADDLLRPKRFEAQFALAEKEKLDWVSCAVEVFGHPPGTTGYPDYVAWHNALRSHKEIWAARYVECPMIHPTWMLRRSVFERAGPYREGPFPEDYEFFLRAAGRSRMGKVAEAHLCWRDRPARVSRTSPRFTRLAFRRLKARFFPLPPSEPFFIWGAGREAKKLARELIRRGIHPAGFADLDPGRIGQTILGVSVLHPEEFLRLEPPRPFVVNAVPSRQAREEIDRWFFEHGFEYEKDYLHF
jgi:glycosyltransferase involved in cell wall biosynthesis